MNKKGFVLIETLVVTIFTLVTFTILYNSAVPLLGKYKELSYYDDLDTTYDLYHISNLIKNDSKYNELKNSHYKKITCNNGTLDNINLCQQIFDVLKILGEDEVIFLNTNYIQELESDTNISDDIKNYLKYINQTGNILLLQNDGYISYLKLNKKLLSDKIEESIQKSTCNPSITDTDGIIYLSGTNDCVNFNYVWYSGKLWRITAINPDGTIKMITDDVMTTTSWADAFSVDSGDSEIYSTSYIRQWLNQEFLPTLYNYENIIEKEAGWYSIIDRNSTPVKPTGEYTLTDPVGLLNAYEYYQSYKNTSYSTGYLNNGYVWWLNTIYFDLFFDMGMAQAVLPDGSIELAVADFSNLLRGYGVRPSVNLKSTIQIVGGSGTVTDPYRIKGDQEEIETNVTLLNTRQSGEYVKLSNEETSPTFRIVDTELVGKNLTTKIVLNDYVRDTNDLDSDADTTEVLMKNFSSLESYEFWTEVDKTDTTYWRGYLNNIWIKEIDNTYNETDRTSSILEKGTYYLGINLTDNYKAAVCSTVSSDVSVGECIATENVVAVKSSDDYVGLLRGGEMFASQFGNGKEFSSEMWLINPANALVATSVWAVNYVSTDGERNYESAHEGLNAARPSVNLKSTIVVKSGSGTQSDPYIVGLPS